MSALATPVVTATIRADVIAVRPLTQSDRAALAFTLHHLGERSRYQRYLASWIDIERRELDRLLTVDHWHHEVLIACHVAPRIPVGVAEYVRGATFDTAELAVSIADDWQRHGIGTQLVDALRERALAVGIRTFTASALHENRGARMLLGGLGRVQLFSSDGPVATWTVSLV
jgi:GNAT superfamily N-acetyltransferase